MLSYARDLKLVCTEHYLNYLSTTTKKNCTTRLINQWLLKSFSWIYYYLLICFFKRLVFDVLNRQYNKLGKNRIGLGSIWLHNQCSVAVLMSLGVSKKSLIQEEVIKQKGNSHYIFHSKLLDKIARGPILFFFKCNVLKEGSEFEALVLCAGKRIHSV